VSDFNKVPNTMIGISGTPCLIFRRHPVPTATGKRREATQGLRPHSPHRDIVSVRLERSLQRSLGDRSSAITKTRGKMCILGTAASERGM